MMEAALRPLAAARPTTNRLSVLPRTLLAALRRWRAKRRSRKRLAELDDWLLRDIGLLHGEAAREVRKSFPWHESPPLPRSPSGWS